MTTENKGVYLWSTNPIWAKLEFDFIPQIILAQKEDSSNTSMLFGNSYTRLKVDIHWSCFEKMSV